MDMPVARGGLVDMPGYYQQGGLGGVPLPTPDPRRYAQDDLTRASADRPFMSLMEAFKNTGRQQREQPPSPPAPAPAPAPSSDYDQAEQLRRLPPAQWRQAGGDVPPPSGYRPNYDRRPWSPAPTPRPAPPLPEGDEGEGQHDWRTRWPITPRGWWQRQTGGDVPRRDRPSLSSSYEPPAPLPPRVPLPREDPRYLWGVKQQGGPLMTTPPQMPGCGVPVPYTPPGAVIPQQPLVPFQRGGGLNIPEMNMAAKQAHFGALNAVRAEHLSMPKLPGVHLIHSAVPGRVDRIPMQARSGSYVLPAHVVSGLGQGNTLAGAKMWGQAIGHSLGPDGIQNTIKAASFRPMALHPIKPMQFQRGGAVADRGYTPIIVSGGEVLVDPEIVEELGRIHGGEGKKFLEHSVKIVHQQTIDHMKKLPGPVK